MPDLVQIPKGVPFGDLGFGPLKIIIYFDYPGYKPFHNHFARFPKPNDAINIDNLRFVISSLERRRIKRIKVSKIL